MPRNLTNVDLTIPTFNQASTKDSNTAPMLLSLNCSVKFKARVRNIFGFFSSRSLKTREKYISFAQLVLLSLYIF